MESLRRYLVLLAVTVCFGGFTFYAAVVVPIGGDVLDPTSQGFVTRRVTHVINLATAATLALLVWEFVAGRAARSRPVNRSWIACLAALALTLAVLLAVHTQLDSLVNADDLTVADPKRFYQLHRVYLWSSTLQWLTWLVILGLLNVRPRSRPVEADPSKPIHRSQLVKADR